MKIVDPYRLSYSRWDNKFNKPHSRLCYTIIKFKGKYGGSLIITLHSIFQYPFSFLKSSNCVGFRIFGIRIFWIQLQIQRAKIICQQI